MQRDTKQGNSVTTDDTKAAPSQNLQLKQQLAGLSVDDQKDALRPPMPLQFNRDGATDKAGPQGPARSVQFAGGTGSTGASAHPKQADLDADKALIKPVASIKDYQTRIKALKVIVKTGEIAGVSKKIDKFYDAVDRTKKQLKKPPTEGYGSGADAKIKQFIDDRVAIVMSYLSDNYKTKAEAAHAAVQASGKVDAKDQFSPDWGVLVDFKKGKQAFDPEEEFSINDVGKIGGIFKVYDVGKIFRSMGRTYQDAWNAVATRKGAGSGKDLFIQECKSSKQLVFAPKGEGKNPPFAGANGLKVFSGKSVDAFVGLGNNATATTYAAAITDYALAPGSYPCGVMLACKADDTLVKSRWGSIKFGKPSIMYLLAFDENTYDETDRTYGHLADPANPEKPGAKLELSIVGLPMSDFMNSSTSSILV